MQQEPIASHARLPDAYGLSQDSHLLEWPHVRSRLVAAPHYWICTISESSTPQPRPIDGLWVGETLYFGGDPGSKWQRNLLANSAAAIHLDDPVRAVIAEGAVSRVKPDRALAELLVAATNEKYGIPQQEEAYEGRGVCAFTTTVVLAWETLHGDATRFTFSR